MNTRLKELRKSRGLSLRDLDLKININYSQLARIERGESYLTQQHIEVLSSFFNVTSDYLLGISDIRMPNQIVAENIPVYSQLYGGSNILREDNKIYDCAAPKTKDLSNSVYLICPKDILSEKIFKGDLLLISLDNKVELGLYVIAADEEPGNIHRVINVNGKWGFLENNNLQVLSDYQVIGKVVSITRDID